MAALLDTAVIFLQIFRVTLNLLLSIKEQPLVGLRKIKALFSRRPITETFNGLCHFSRVKGGSGAQVLHYNPALIRALTDENITIDEPFEHVNLDLLNRASELRSEIAEQHVQVGVLTAAPCGQLPLHFHGPLRTGGFLHVGVQPFDVVWV